MSGEDIAGALDMIKMGKKAGSVIVISQQPEAAQIEGLVKAGIKVVLIEGKHPKAVMISVDNENGAQIAAERMRETGTKKPGLIIGHVKMINSQKERLRGFKKVFKDNFTAYELREHSFEDGILAYRALADKGVDSVFCAAGDLVAYGFLFESGKYSKKIKIIGFDDDQLSESMGLTTVRQDVKGMGAAAFRAASSETNQGTINFGTELIVRHSG
jgi:DNA-binding LacI/PurR family transcriptional regulator